MPGKPFCKSKAALIGNRPWRCKNARITVGVNSAEVNWMGSDDHHVGGSIP